VYHVPGSDTSDSEFNVSNESEDEDYGRKKRRRGAGKKHKYPSDAATFASQPISSQDNPGIESYYHISSLDLSFCLNTDARTFSLDESCWLARRRKENVENSNAPTTVSASTLPNTTRRSARNIDKRNSSVSEMEKASTSISNLRHVEYILNKPPPFFSDAIPCNATDRVEVESIMERMHEFYAKIYHQHVLKKKEDTAAAMETTDEEGEYYGDFENQSFPPYLGHIHNDTTWEIRTSYIQPAFKRS